MQFTPEQIQQFLAQQQQKPAPLPPPNQECAVQPPGQTAAPPIAPGFDDAEVFSSSRKIHEYQGTFRGRVRAMQFGQTSSPEKGIRPLFTCELTVTASSNADLPVGSEATFTKTGGTGFAQTYFYAGIKNCLGAILAKSAKTVNTIDLTTATGVEQPHVGVEVGWDTFQKTSTRTGKTSIMIDFSTVSDDLL